MKLTLFVPPGFTTDCVVPTEPVSKVRPDKGSCTAVEEGASRDTCARAVTTTMIANSDDMKMNATGFRAFFRLPVSDPRGTSRGQSRRANEQL
jgi:hypothetical protein